ncbi:hypothetical protein LWI28_007867 [Acer negundo]|uniref:Uncharacterized protein n=1 Tax=Acer negundo TaxID=4023 RepID=A0AAD5IU95_ACENE|nr:hypothetical protein LWI28_007867 [Acer negundo]
MRLEWLRSIDGDEGLGRGGDRVGLGRRRQRRLGFEILHSIFFSNSCNTLMVLFDKYSNGNMFSSIKRITILVEDKVAMKGRIDYCRILVATSEVSVSLDVVSVEVASKKVNSLAKSHNEKLVVFETKVRSRCKAGDKSMVAERDDKDRRLVRPISLHVDSAAGDRCQMGGLRYSSIGLEDIEFSKRKFTAIKVKKKHEVFSELDAEFARVIEESIPIGVKLDEVNRFYGEDGGWCVEEKVAKVLETEAVLGLKLLGNEESLGNEISSRDKEG